MNKYLFLLLCLFGCSKQVLLPLDTGRSVVYERTFYSFETGERNDSFFDTDRVGIPVIIRGEEYRSVANRDRILYYINKPEGLWALNLDTTVFYHFKYPATAGERYDVQTIGPANEPNEQLTGGWQVLSVDTLITIPSGSYHCYHYRFEFTRGATEVLRRQEAYWAPKTGLVYYESSERPDRKLIRTYSEALVSIREKK